MSLRPPTRSTTPRAVNVSQINCYYYEQLIQLFIAARKVSWINARRNDSVVRLQAVNCLSTLQIPPSIDYTPPVISSQALHNIAIVSSTTTTPPQPFHGPVSGTTRWAGATRKLLLDFMVPGWITRGRHTDSPGGRHSIRTNQQSTPISTPHSTLDALPAATLKIYRGLGQAQEYAGLHTPVAWFN